jgi:putative oxidoreductase
MFRKFNSTQINQNALSFGLLLFRVGTGLLMIPHGYNKLINFETYSKDFTNFLGLGPAISLSLVIGAEFFCSIFLCIGLFTRVALIPLIITMLVALINAHHGDILGKGGSAFQFLISYILLLLSGPGRFSLDRTLFR